MYTSPFQSEQSQALLHSPCSAEAALVICLGSRTRLIPSLWNEAKAHPSSLPPPLSTSLLSCTEAVTAHTPVHNNANTGLR